ncbi:hypothetical protein TEA_001456 [Camellia sinensis var. sinensis]|uniref:DNA-directed RNA polymerase RpoA/D/Rpb3-type domain-containing protein n=1 Tax=Camellia sinensis var. sinensis TaxID=542762 RepID=A0A4V3WKE8_CAMSN|nr:hypothetical protein TEA_001456 [Camellia sinensis var. sinensis]
MNPTNNSQDGSYPIDAVSMPVRNANHSIHSYGNGNEKQEILFLEIWTNGSLTPKEALYEASRQEVDSEISNQLVGLMVYLSIEDDTKDLYLVMIHQPASSFYEAQAGEFILEAEELLKLRETLTKVYVQRTGNPLWVISEDMERDVFMSATEAQAHGIVDLVAVENETTGDFV